MGRLFIYLGASDLLLAFPILVRPGLPEQRLQNLADVPAGARGLTPAYHEALSHDARDVRAGELSTVRATALDGDRLLVTLGA